MEVLTKSSRNWTWIRITALGVKLPQLTRKGRQSLSELRVHMHTRKNKDHCHLLLVH